MQTSLSFEECLTKLEKNNWDLDDVFAEGSELDFSRPFLPTSLTYHNQITTFESPQMAVVLNQIMAKSYLNLFYFVEEFIIKEMDDLASESNAETAEHKSISLFHDQEIKHQQLFKRFLDSFDKGFKIDAKVLDCEKEIANIIMSNSLLSVLLITLHLEIITQDHYKHSVKDDVEINQDVANILKHHWIEEAQHANIDYLELLEHVKDISDEQGRETMEAYGGMLAAFNNLLAIQAQYDITSLERYFEFSFTAQQFVDLQYVQHQGYTNIFINNGLDNPRFNKIVQQCFPNNLSSFERVKSQFAQQN